MTSNAIHERKEVIIMDDLKIYGDIRKARSNPFS